MKLAHGREEIPRSPRERWEREEGNYFKNLYNFLILLSPRVLPAIRFISTNSTLRKHTSRSLVLAMKCTCTSGFLKSKNRATK